MRSDIEAGVREAQENFQGFVLVQIVAAWFADAPDPEALVEEMLAKWSDGMRRRYSQAARQQAEATGIIVAEDDWIDSVIHEARLRIRKSLIAAIERERASNRATEKMTGKVN